MKSYFAWSLALGLFVSAFAGAATPVEQVAIDSQNSSLGFVSHMFLGSVKGQFDYWTASIEVHHEDILKSSVHVKIDAKSINTDNHMRDKHLRGDDFFASEKFPEIIFQSKSVTPIADERDHYNVVGDLTIRGKTKEITFPAEIHEKEGVITANAKFAINRQDFGIEYKSYFNPIKDEVTIRFDIATAKPASP